MPDFILTQWRAWAPGLNIPDARLIESADLTAPHNVPKMLQRRLTPLARAVFNATTPCLGDGKAIPVVFSSGHGEICKSLTLLRTIQAQEELSPAAFSLSVHNAIAGLFSIIFKINQEISVIAPCQEGMAPAFIEALGLLTEDAEEVLLVFYDEPIADFYPVAPFNLNSNHPCVLSLRLALTGAGLAMNLQRSDHFRDDGEHPAQILKFIEFLLTAAQQLHLGNQLHSWTWRKH